MDYKHFSKYKRYCNKIHNIKFGLLGNNNNVLCMGWAWGQQCWGSHIKRILFHILLNIHLKSTTLKRKQNIFNIDKKCFYKILLLNKTLESGYMDKDPLQICIY